MGATGAVRHFVAEAFSRQIPGALQRKRPRSELSFFANDIVVSISREREPRNRPDHH